VKQEKYDLIFNIAEGLKGRGREGQVPSILEVFNQPYSGSDPVTMGVTLDKTLAKIIAAHAGVLTPRWMQAQTPDEIKNIHLTFPVIVKPTCEGTSKGVSADSLCRNKEELVVQVEKINKRYHQPSLIEEFIVGSEYTVALIGNGNAQALPPVQILIQGTADLGEEFYTTERVYNQDIGYVCPDNIPVQLQKELKQSAVTAYKALGCRDFGRIDFRVDKEGRAFFLECNPLPNISRSDVFPLIAEKMGLDYSKIIVWILNQALTRYHLISSQVVSS
ncbi:MAG: ATP-grasp domain-containing protein, partial [bacterium]